MEPTAIFKFKEEQPAWCNPGTSNMIYRITELDKSQISGSRSAKLSTLEEKLTYGMEFRDGTIYPRLAVCVYDGRSREGNQFTRASRMLIVCTVKMFVRSWKTLHMSQEKLTTMDAATNETSLRLVA